TENTDSQTTENSDNSEPTETETPIDPFAQDENADVTISAENLGELSGDVILLADNDITINEKIETDSSVELKAGRSININADIDTSVGNGNIDLFGNNDEMNIANRSNGKASINQLDGTTLNAGSGTINIQLGNLGEVGDINLASLTTTGEVLVNANGGNIARVSSNSLINAGSVLFQTSGDGGIGLIDAPLRLNVENLEAVSGSGGIFFDVGNVNIGGVSEEVDGIVTAGGDIDIKSDEDVTLSESISTIETAENNSEVEATENTEITDNSETTENTEINSKVELKASRSININADIDTSVTNGNIYILGNNDEMNIANRSNGKASINQLDGTTLNAGSGTINIQLGNLGEVGDINLASLTTTGEVLVNANGGNIARVSSNSLINAGSVLFQTSGDGGIGLIDAPLRLNVENLEAVSGSGGIFFDVGNVNIGGVSEEVDGIVTAGGDIDIKSDGNVTLTETISTIETVENNSEISSTENVENSEIVENNSEISSTENTEIADNNDVGGSINIEATGDIIATGSGIKGGGESVSLSATNIRINDEFEETSGDADIKLEATNDITVEDIDDDVLEFQPGGGEIEFRADVDGDGIGVVEMLDNEADDGSDQNTFENGADTIKTNGRNLTIAGAEIVLGNIDTSSPLPVFFGGELLATIDVDEGGAIPAEGTEGTATFTFTVDGDLETIENLDVRFSAEHTYDGDLVVDLKSPEGKEITLFAGVGGSDDNFQDTLLDDNASTGISSGNAPFDGTYRPQESLAEFNGENPNGTWTLRVEDRAGGDSGRLYKAGDDAVWGTTAIGTQLLLRSPLVESAGGRGSGNGGAINLEATHDNIRVGNIRSFSETGDGGRIDLKANKNIITGLINSSSSQGNGGNVNLNSISGNIDTFSLDTSSFDGDGGDITISAGDNINIGNVNSSSSGGDNGDNIAAGNSSVGNVTQTAGGNVNISISAGSDIQTADGNVNISISAGDITQTATEDATISNSAVSDIQTTSGNAGDITISANGNIQTASVSGQNITIDSQSGVVDTSAGSLNTKYNEDGGNIQITADGNIQTASVSGQNITIDSQSGSVDTSTGFLNTNSFNEEGGNIEITANGNIKTASVSGQNITIDSQIGGIDTSAGSLNTNSFNEDGGNIEITANGNIKTASVSGQNITIESRRGNIDTSASSLNASSDNEEGGNIEITADGNIKTASVSGQNITIDSQRGSINTLAGSLRTSLYNQDGGNIQITADGNIQTASLNSSSFGESSGDGGNINITSNNGNITIISGDTFTSRNIPTIINSSSKNGTAGDITITSERLITLAGQVLATGNTQGGNVSLTSKLSDVNASLAIFNRTSENGTNGNLNITANNGSIDMGEFSGSRNITIADGGESEEFSDRPNANITSDADKVNEKSGEVTLQAHNDITINESINAEDISKLELRAGRDININADIDTSSSNGDIVLSANDQGADLQYRGEGAGDITMAADTTINAGSGKISISIGNLAEVEVGDITLSNLQTTGNITVDANGGNIFRSSENSLITAGNAALRTKETGSIGTETEPLNISLENLSARSGSGGVFFNSPNQGVNIGNASNVITGISTQDGGDIQVTAKGYITVTESLFTASIERLGANEQSGNITLKSTEGRIDTTATNLNSSSINGSAGNVELSASGDIKTANISAYSENGNGGNITIKSENGSIETTEGAINSYSDNKSAGNVELSASGDIKTANISASSENGNGGNISISSISGDIITGSLDASSSSYSYSSIDISSENGDGGNITITSNNGSVDTTGGFISSYSDNGSAGNVNISASGDVKTGDINTYSGKLENNDQETGQTEETGESNEKVREETGNNESPNIEELGNGNGGHVTITSENGSVDTTNGWIGTSANGKAGNVEITASGDINTGDISSYSYVGKGGNINITSNNGIIDTTKGYATLFEPLADDANITSEEVAKRFESTAANLDAYAPEGTGGNVTLTAKGDITTYEISSYGGNSSGNVNIISTEGNIKTDVIFSTGVNESGGNISIQTQEEGNININHIATYSTNGTGGEVNLDSIGNVIINNIASFGEQQSGNISISSESEINTANLTTQSDAGPSGNIFVNGRNIATGNLRSLGRTAAGKIQVQANDGSIRTADIESSSTAGEAGGIDFNATEDIETGDQTVEGVEGDATINNQAGGDINTGDQIATTENGDATINNQAGRDINTGDQI
ncbi:proprotein convertase P-domain-containing protein, partial [Dapis sp. BLCC M172]|uniref:proprotein convertase P-domain-containing protein n=1 Tax=Dapis sp. BLCC M172 TaxID=2975281 RepID=UPI003CF1E7A1